MSNSPRRLPHDAAFQEHCRCMGVCGVLTIKSKRRQCCLTWPSKDIDTCLNLSALQTVQGHRRAIEHCVGVETTWLEWSTKVRGLCVTGVLHADAVIKYCNGHTMLMTRCTWYDLTDARSPGTTRRTDPDPWRILHQLHCPLQHQLAAVVVTKHAYTAWEARASSLKARA